MKKLILTSVLFAIGLSAQAQVSALYGDGTPDYSVSNNTADSVSCRFTTPYGCAYDTKGNLWITDQGNNYIVMITAGKYGTGKYELREGYDQGGFLDGTSVGSAGGITTYPAGIVVVPGKTSAADQIYVCDAGNNAIRKIDSFVAIGQGQRMSTVAGGGPKTGNPGKSGYVDGTGANALFNGPTGLGYVKDANGGYLVVADLGNNAVRKVSLHRSDYGTTSTIDTTIQNPVGIFVDSVNDIFVASNNAGVVEIPYTGKEITIVPPTYFEAGAGSVAVKGSDMYIGDYCHILYFDMKQKPSPTNPSILTGDPADTICSFEDGTYTQALFNGITSLTLSQDGTYLIVADAQNNRFRKMVLPAHHDTSGFRQIHASINTFNIFPNPANGYIYIKNKVSANADLALYTITGKQVLNENNVALSAGQPYSINIENQPAGVYVLQITTNKGVYNNKIIIR